MERLQQILFFKEMGFSLKEIQKNLGHTDFYCKRALEVYLDILLQRKNAWKISSTQ
ncbi:hypothetical protein [Lederbergia panacisoli]|uniref:hypothetical protein n=1 Tax=Lederbergia panacisoli TaxID=1255251 RepID=UPI00214AE7AC|nr:hypothetical protein [Lederbergia panacisoli]MCR2822724.1 hypothetical protein [Lederbergia panacisoli]